MTDADEIVRKVLVVGDNRTSASILDGLQDSGLALHQIVSKHSWPSSKHGVARHVSDFSPGSLTDIFQDLKPDLVINTLSGGSYDTQKEIVESAVTAGITRFMPAEFGQDSLNTKLQQRLPPAKERARFIEYLDQLSRSGILTWVAVALGCILDYGIQSGNLGFDLKWQSATMHGTGDERFAASSSEWVGRVVVSIIQHWSAVENQYIYACGTVTTSNEVLKFLEHSTRGQWEAGRAEAEDCVREAERRIERGFPDAGMFLMERSVLYDESLGAVRPFMEQDAKGILALREERAEEVIRRALHEHHHHGKGDCGCG